ncbi:disulfide bond formation protein B [Rhizobium sp. L1K21]|uniref:disulfide bond formation protein B n=1 Tax=Rhizobium sp. L1K21 TaxID=2954933 RepID=UPI00209383DE|nr:disulfide bond formation protein B [Rhizobium sp. L1K21]MCO6188189.1 disulfide bond formation protein B [Rhizobium sp. L1K21]
MSGSLIQKPAFAPTLLVTLGMAAAVGSALAFQYIGGYIPCQLCYIQRNPYYIGIPLGLIALLLMAFDAPPKLVRIVLLLILLLMLVGAGLGIYHSGVEWHFWEGPASCSAPVDSVPSSANDLFADLNKIKGPSCTEAALRVLGLSFAGWNVVASLILAAIAFWGLRKTAR